MATLPRLKPACFYDLVVEIALIRPGPIVGEMVHPYINRRAGREPVTYPHPCLEPILKRTLGVPIFQEQILKIAMEAAGFSGGEAEELRRAMGFKRSIARMQSIEDRLQRGMEAKGLSPESQEAVTRYITAFALYGFPESHSASFALIAYASAYLKRHHPAAFLVGLLNAWPMGFYSPATLVKEAQRSGVSVHPIDVVRSEWKCTLENGEPDSPPHARIGMRYASGLREEVGQQIVAARTDRPFDSLADLAGRVPFRRSELDTLAELGALSALERGDRRAALWQVAALERDPNSLFAGKPPGAAGSRPNGGPVSSPSPSHSPSHSHSPRSAVSPLPVMSALEDTLADYRLSSLTTGPQLMAHLRAGLSSAGILSARQIREQPDGRWVKTAGHVIVRQRPGSGKVCFVTLEDETGTSNSILMPDVFKRFRSTLHTSAVLQIEGPLQQAEGVTHIRARSIEPVSLEANLPPGHNYR
jgi:error-prone DNA polymerase